MDARHPTRFAAAWLLGSLAQLAAAGMVSAVTYFETTGWRGVMERDEGSPQPRDFASTPGATYPVYDALALLAGFTHLRPCRSSDPDRVAAICVENVSRRRLILANLTASPIAVHVGEGDALVQLGPYAHDSLDHTEEVR